VTNAKLPTPYPPKKDPVPIAQKAEWASVPIWTSAQNLAFTEVRSPDLPIFTYMLLLPEGQWDKDLEPPKDAMLFRTSEEHRIEKYFHADF
jgi:hypothetical protein